MLLSIISGSSFLRYTRSRRQSASTSAGGRFQFSTEKAYRVSAWMPRRAQVSTVVRTGSIPALWPATRGKLRWCAQRPLPSMMMAMCAGRRSGSIACAKIQSGCPGFTTSNKDFITQRTIVPRAALDLRSQTGIPAENRIAAEPNRQPGKT